MCILSRLEACLNLLCLCGTALTGEDRADIKRVQKCALQIILGSNYLSHTSAIKEFGLETLFRRRQKLCLTFAKKSYKNPKFNKWFKLNLRITVTRQPGSKLVSVYSRTKRFEESPISYITEMLNRVKK